MYATSIPTITRPTKIPTMIVVARLLEMDLESFFAPQNRVIALKIRAELAHIFRLLEEIAGSKMVKEQERVDSRRSRVCEVYLRRRAACISPRGKAVYAVT